MIKYGIPLLIFKKLSTASEQWENQVDINIKWPILNCALSVWKKLKICYYVYQLCIIMLYYNMMTKTRNFKLLHICLEIANYNSDLSQLVL